MINHTILISGESGFIGKYISIAAKSRNIEVIPTPRIESGYSDFETFIEKTVSTRGKNSISFVLASWARTDLENYRSNIENLEWPIHVEFLAKTLRKHSISFFGIGSCIELSTDSEDCYMKSKRMARSILETVMGKDSWTWLRFFYVYSIVDRRPNLVKSAHQAVSDGQPINLKDPNKLHDFIDVEDVASAVCVVVLNNIKGDVDIGSGRLTSVQNFVNGIFPNSVIKDISTVDVELRSGYSSPANTKALKGFGWNPVITSEIFPK